MTQKKSKNILGLFNLFPALIKAGFILTAIGFAGGILCKLFISDTTLMLISSSLIYALIVGLYLFLASRSSAKAGKYKRSEELIKDIRGDIGVLLLSIIILLVWLVLPVGGAFEVSDASYFIYLAFLFLMFFVSLWELLLTVDIGVERMETLNQTNVN